METFVLYMNNTRAITSLYICKFWQDCFNLVLVKYNIFICITQMSLNFQQIRSAASDLG